MLPVKKWLDRKEWQWASKVLLFYAGVFAPIFCFSMAVSGIHAFDLWQDGRLQTYGSLLMMFPPAAVFYPLLLYCMGCLTLLLWNWTRWSDNFIVRFGIYSGVLLAGQYCLLLYCPSDGSWQSFAQLAGGIAMLMGATAVAIAVLVLVLFVLFAIIRRFGWKRTLLSIVAVLAALGLLALVGYEEPLLAPFASLFFPTLILGPTWSLLVYGGFAIALLRRQSRERFQFSLKRGMGVVTWFAAYFGAWRVSVDWMLIEYAKLPTEDPSCFVATAAARGHGKLVSGQIVELPSGKRVRVSRQLQVLKAAEISLAAALPRIHHLLRRVYNYVGPPLASRITSPWLADAAYLALKPAEWIARAALALLLPDHAARISQLYRGRWKTLK